MGRRETHQVTLEISVIILQQVQYALLLVLGAAAPVVGVYVYGWPRGSYVSLLALVLSLGPLRLVWTAEDPMHLIAALGGTARVVAVYGVLLAAGLSWG